LLVQEEQITNCIFGFLLKRSTLCGYRESREKKKKLSKSRNTGATLKFFRFIISILNRTAERTKNHLTLVRYYPYKVPLIFLRRKPAVANYSTVIRLLHFYSSFLLLHCLQYRAWISDYCTFILLFLFLHCLQYRAWERMIIATSVRISDYCPFILLFSIVTLLTI
jgi:hypothetical protein